MLSAHDVQLQNYLNKMIADVSGMKVLLLDEETVGFHRLLNPLAIRAPWDGFCNY